MGHRLQRNELRRPRRLAVIEPANQRVVADREVGGFKEHSTQIPIGVLRLAGLLAVAVTEGVATDAPTIGDSSQTIMGSRGEKPPLSVSPFTDTKTTAA